MMERAYKLLGILQSYAPTNAEQALCTTIYNRMQADGLTVEEIEAQLITALSDGVQHGNWFWININLTTDRV